MLAHFGGMSTRWEATSRSKSDLSVLLEITFKTNRIDCMSYSDKDYDSKINCICVGASLISMRRKQENQGSNVSTQTSIFTPPLDIWLLTIKSKCFTSLFFDGFLCTV